jgi:hypothetical protein
MYSHGPHIDVTDLELSPIVEMWSDIYRILNSISGVWAAQCPIRDAICNIYGRRGRWPMSVAVGKVQE